MSTSRRESLRWLATEAVGLCLSQAGLAAGEPPLETKRLRLVRYPTFDAACLSPMWIAEELLHAEGFDDVRYVPLPTSTDMPLVQSGEVDITLTDIFAILSALDSRKPPMVLAGIHGGCYELYGSSGLHTVRDLRGKTIAVADEGRRSFVSVMLSNVGLDPRKDVTFVESMEGAQLLHEGKVDATLGFPPEPQVMRARKIGVSIVNTAVDKPWSQYFCCMAVGNRDFVARNPVATKRALRALIKATELCAAEPETVARKLVARGFYKDYESSAQSVKDVPYRRWREYDSADSLRFYALRLHETGLIKSNPAKLLAQGTDWRFVEQLKTELKS